MGEGWLFPFSFSEVSTNRSPLDGCRASIQLVVDDRGWEKKDQLNEGLLGGAVGEGNRSLKMLF